VRHFPSKINPSRVVQGRSRAPLNGVFLSKVGEKWGKDVRQLTLAHYTHVRFDTSSERRVLCCQPFSVQPCGLRHDSARIGVCNFCSMTTNQGAILRHFRVRHTLTCERFGPLRGCPAWSEAGADEPWVVEWGAMCISQTSGGPNLWPSEPK